jgi:hypothetical protein
MRKFSEFHDGWFEGLWIDGKTVHIFLATEGRERFVFVANEVSELFAENVMCGNIIFEVLLRETEEVNLQDIHALYKLKAGPSDEKQSDILLEKARLQNRKILEIHPSYGASCFILASSFKVFGREDWLKRYFTMSEMVTR